MKIIGEYKHNKKLLPVWIDESNLEIPDIADGILITNSTYVFMKFVSKNKYKL